MDDEHDLSREESLAAVMPAITEAFRWIDALRRRAVEDVWRQ